MRYRYKIKIDPAALLDLQDITDYYNFKQAGLGRKFIESFKDTIRILKTNPLFQIRYDNVRCLPVKIFPYLVHYIVDNKTVTIYAIISTHQNPDNNRVTI